MLIYLSHPIDNATIGVADDIKKGKARLLEAINSHGVNAVVFQPQEAFFVSEKATVGPEIEMINQAAQKQANVMIVFWPAGSKSWGVPVEVERAISSGIPVAFCIEGKPSWAMPQAWHDNPLFKVFRFTTVGIGDAVEWLAGVEASDIGQDLIPTKLLNDKAHTPSKAYVDDAGFDLYVSEDTVIQPGEFVDVPCAVAVELPSDTWALLTGRSSTLRKKGLMVNQGVIDPGYRGELFAGVWNLSKNEVRIDAGDRLAQLILMPNHALNAKLITVNELAPHQRGQSGFGSSGK